MIKVFKIDSSNPALKDLLELDPLETHFDAGVEAQRQAFGVRLATFRTLRKMTQGELAERLDKSRTTINQYEKGNIAPPLSVIDELAVALGVDPIALAYGRTGQAVDAGETYKLPSNGEQGAVFITVPPIISQRLGLGPDTGGLLELDSDAPYFGLRRNDLLIVDTTRTEARGDGRLYVAEMETGDLSLIRPDVQLEGNATVLRVTLGQGQISEVRADKLKVRGLVKASIKFE